MYSTFVLTLDRAESRRGGGAKYEAVSFSVEAATATPLQNEIETIKTRFARRPHHGEQNLL